MASLQADRNVWGIGIRALIILSAPCVSRDPNAPAAAGVILVSQFFIGLGIGVHYRGITVAELKRDILAALGYIFILATIAIGTMIIASEFSTLRDADVFLAFWPAGQG